MCIVRVRSTPREERVVPLFSGRRKEILKESRGERLEVGVEEP